MEKNQKRVLIWFAIYLASNLLLVYRFFTVDFINRFPTFPFLDLVYTTLLPASLLQWLVPGSIRYWADGVLFVEIMKFVNAFAILGGLFYSYRALQEHRKRLGIIFLSFFIVILLITLYLWQFTIIIQ